MSYQNLRLEGKGEGINVLRIDPAQGGGLESKERTRVMLLFGAGTRQLVSAELALRLARRLADEIGGNDEVELAMGGESVSAGAQLSAMDIALVPVAHPAGYRAAWDDIKATWEGEASCEDEEMLSEGEEHEKVRTRLKQRFATMAWRAARVASSNSDCDASCVSMEPDILSLFHPTSRRECR